METEISTFPEFISFPNYIECLSSAHSVTRYGHKRKIDLDLKPTFFKLKYEKLI